MSARALILAVLALVVLGLPVAAFAYDRARDDHVAEGVTVGGIDVGGRSAEAARAVVRERVAGPARRDVVVEHGKETYTLPADEAGVEVDVEATVQAAVDAGRDGNFVTRTLRDLSGGRVEADVEPRLRYDEAEVDEFVDFVGDEADRRPDDARVDASGEGLEVVKSKKGFRTKREELRRRVAGALERPRGDRALTVPGKKLDPETTVADLEQRHPHFITIDREDFRLRYFRDLDREETYRISVGRAGHETPAGLYDISTKATNPTWHVPDEPWAGEKRGEVIPPGPENPIKARWLGIEDGVGIHGTDDTSSIGERASHGCIRMRIPEVKELYDRVPVGTKVYIG